MENLARDARTESDAMDATTARNEARTTRPSVPLHIALLVDRAHDLDNWQLALIDRILADNRFHLKALILCPPRQPKARRKLFRMAAKLERAALGRQPPYPAIEPGFSNIPVEILETFRNESSEHELDLVLALSPLDLDQTNFARLPFGCWHFSFLNSADHAADWFGYDEVISGQSTTELAITVKRGEAGTSEVLASAWFNTKFSAARNGDFLKERAVSLVMRELRHLARNGALETQALIPADTVTDTGTVTVPHPPGTLQLLRYLSGLTKTLLMRGRRALSARLKLSAPAWALFLGEGDAESFDPRTARLLKPELPEFRADPFLFEEKGETYVFYEAYSARDTKAHIAVSRLEGDRLERIGVALQAAHHLSYPFVFRDGDQIFMIPETNQAKRLEVWRATDFPLGWELHATALEGQSPADSALIRFSGRWWLFTNLSEYHAYEDHCSELHLFEVDGPDLKWLKPHHNNPVVMGSTEARNGGRPYERGGRLFRPSQRNEHGIYGYGLNIMEVEQLDLTTYRERCIRKIDPDFAPGIIACHHMDAVNGRFILDAMFEDQSQLLR